MKEAATSPGIGTAMPDAGSTTTIGIAGATGTSASAIMVEGGGDTIIADAYGVPGTARCLAGRCGKSPAEQATKVRLRAMLGHPGGAG